MRRVAPTCGVIAVLLLAVAGCGGSDLVELPTPQRRLVHVSVWKRWSDVNLTLPGTPSSTVRAVGFCRTVASVRSHPVCVVADRITASGRAALPACAGPYVSSAATAAAAIASGDSSWWSYRAASDPH